MGNLGHPLKDGGIDMDFREMLHHAEEYYFLVELALILAAAAFGGWLAKLIKMPPVLGQILVGIVIGPTVFDFLHGEDELIHIMSQIGVVFLMFLAGLETDLKELKKSGKGASMIAVGGVVMPLVLGTLVPLIFFTKYLPGDSSHDQFMSAIFVGTILTATSVSISVSVLRELRQLGSRQGISILGGAIIDDVFGIILLAIVSGMVSPSGSTDIFALLMRIAIFMVVLLVFGYFGAKLITKVAQGTVWRDRILSIAVITCLLLAFAAEMFNVAAITGAYAAGVIFAATPYRHRVVDKVQSMAYTLFTPIFFVSIGLNVQIDERIFGFIGYAITLVTIAVLAKVIGCGVGAKLSGFTNKRAMQIGIGMIARAEVALIVANQGIKSGIISDETFTSIVLLVVISTIVTPPLLKLLFKGEKPVIMPSYEGAEGV